MTKYIQDYYGILEVESDADNQTIKEAYECNMKKYHPDVNNGAKAQKRYRLSQEAYDVLSDGEKRREYDILREKAIANQKKKEEEEKAKIDADKLKKSTKSNKSSFNSKRGSGMKGKGRSKNNLSNPFDLINNASSSNVGKILSTTAKAGKSSSALSLSKLILGGAATAYGVKKGKDMMSKGGKNQ